MLLAQKATCKSVKVFRFPAPNKGGLHEESAEVALRQAGSDLKLMNGAVDVRGVYKGHIIEVVDVDVRVCQVQACAQTVRRYGTMSKVQNVFL